MTKQSTKTTRKNIQSICPPYLGAAYYPEVLSDAEITYDINMMKDMGINVIRLAEFAWSTMEPNEGEYHFEWLHNVIKRFEKAQIGVILGTPTATPPVWLTEKYPDLLVVNANRIPMQHGGRRHACSRNEHYLEACDKIVAKMGEEFGNKKNVIGWQLDNEMAVIHAQGCFCETCRKGFATYLREKYGTIETLNHAWALPLWSQDYQTFEQVPAPEEISGTPHNPHIRLDWLLYQERGHINMIRRQEKVLRKYTSAPIGTDTYQSNRIDPSEIHRTMDVVQFNHYNNPENLWEVMFWFDYFRNLKTRPFWNTETSTGWAAAREWFDSLRPDGFCRINSWLAYALGGEANLYWHWRSHRGGFEVMHGSVVSACGRPLHMVGEIRQLATELKKSAEFLRNTTVHTPIAMIYSGLSHRMQQAQPIVQGVEYLSTLRTRFYRELLRTGERIDVLPPEADLSPYRLLFTPMLLTLEDKTLIQNIKKWVLNGGTWVVGPLTDIRNQYGALYTKHYLGTIEQFLGIECLYSVPDRDGIVQAKWNDGTPFHGDLLYDFFDPEQVESIVTCTGGSAALEGKSIVCSHKAGKGSVILLGTFPSSADMQKLLGALYPFTNITPIQTEGDVTVIPRKGVDQSGIIVCEYGGKEGKIVLEQPMLNLLTDSMVTGVQEIPPYGILVLRDL